MASQSKEAASTSPSSCKTAHWNVAPPPDNKSPLPLYIQHKAEGYSMQAIVDAMAAQHPDRPQPTVPELLEIARSLGFLNPDGSVNHNAPIPSQTPKVTYYTNIETSGMQTIETPAGEDNAFHAIIGSMKAQMPQQEPPTLAELREVARSLGLSPPFGNQDLAAVLESWGKTKGIKLGLGVSTGKKE
ncbi:hypothetical protein LSUE1_G004806 [Lachnellula suecica]|uniref:Uncharacterized protein n=1 Tax=Lachnellula suecica TaxID=602035 RepID=A0A8T9C7Q0_9HELO|nr:hypothetical protein LSUE1_G004806 [Lachnellula suecica]